MSRLKYSGQDYCRTPEIRVREFVREFEENVKEISGVVLDPCAGTCTYERVLQTLPRVIELFSLDIRVDCESFYNDDYLSVYVNDICGKKPRFIMMHPPISHAQQFIEKAIGDVEEDGYVCAFLPVPLFVGRKAKKFMSEKPPSFVFLHSSETRLNQRDPYNQYAHVVWKKCVHVHVTTLFKLI